MTCNNKRKRRKDCNRKIKLFLKGKQKKETLTLIPIKLEWGHEPLMLNMVGVQDQIMQEHEIKIES